MTILATGNLPSSTPDTSNAILLMILGFSPVPLNRKVGR